MQRRAARVISGTGVWAKSQGTVQQGGKQGQEPRAVEAKRDCWYKATWLQSGQEYIYTGKPKQLLMIRSVSLSLGSDEGKSRQKLV